MKTEWLKKSGRENLIVFYNGWGMDNTPFSPLVTDNYDVLGCFDYRNYHEKPDIESLEEQYLQLFFVGWSMGVYFGQLHFNDTKEIFSRRIAINGTLSPMDDLYGIPCDIFRDTAERLNADNLERFYKRMCRCPQTKRIFLQNRPGRGLRDQKEELHFIASTSAYIEEEHSMYSDIIVSEKDYVIPSRNQLRYWRKSKVRVIQAAHFPFYTWSSWDHIAELGN